MTPKWYVIQVLGGREEAMAELIGKVTPAEVLSECFCPMFATETKVRGAFVPVTRVLLPGYVIAVTVDPRGVADSIARLPEFCRVLRQGGDGAFVPLDREEVDFIGRFTSEGARVVPMSKGIKDGDRVVVTEGPLLGHEGMVSGVDRKKSVAYLEVNICGRRVRTRVGLAIVSAAVPTA